MMEYHVHVDASSGEEVKHRHQNSEANHQHEKLVSGTVMDVGMATESSQSGHKEVHSG